NSTHLSSLCKQYYVGDSIVVFLDGIRNEYKAYYDGNIYLIESFLAGDPLSNLKVSDNIAAYDNYAGQFRIFYRGDLISQEAYEVSSFKVGRNTVAYVDANRQFKICYKASIQTSGLFRRGYQVEDFIVAYQDASGYFNVFYKGEITALETYFPDSLTIRYNSLAYVNRMNVLRMFSEGEVYDVSTMFSNSAADRNSWQMAYDVLQYKVGSNLYRIFYKGREY